MDLHRRMALSCLLVLFPTLLPGGPPAVGEKAPDFSLESIQSTKFTLSGVTAQGPVVLLVLRGYPGYQCPICSWQANDFIRHAEGFAAANTRVVMVYPGPSDKLKERAAEFTAGKTFELLSKRR